MSKMIAYSVCAHARYQHGSTVAYGSPFPTQASSGPEVKKRVLVDWVCWLRLVPLVRACFCMVAEQLPVQGSC